MALMASATPPALGLSRWRYGDCWRACLAGVKRVPSMKLVTLVGIRANLAQARRVASWSLARNAGFLRKAASLWRRIKGKSSAHQARPIRGTQIRACLIKNLSSGMRRFSTCCNTKISAAAWWLAFTRYHCLRCKLSRPCTSHTVRWVSAIQALLPRIQVSATATSKGSRTSRTARQGSSNLSTAITNTSGTHSRVLASSRLLASRPRSGAGRPCSIGLI